MVWIPADYETEMMGRKFHHDRDWMDIQERCSTWPEAEAQHQRVVDEIRKDNQDDPVEEILEEHQKVQVS